MDLELSTNVFVELDTRLIHGVNKGGAAPKYHTVHIKGDGRMVQYREVFQSSHLTLCRECFPPAEPLHPVQETQPRFIFDPTGRYDFRKAYISVGNGSRENPYQLKYYDQRPSEQFEND